MQSQIKKHLMLLFLRISSKEVSSEYLTNSLSVTNKTIYKLHLLELGSKDQNVLTKLGWAREY